MTLSFNHFVNRYLLDNILDGILDGIDIGSLDFDKVYGVNQLLYHLFYSIADAELNVSHRPAACIN